MDQGGAKTKQNEQIILTEDSPVSDFFEYWDGLKKYVEQEKALDILFANKDNSQLTTVLLKSAALNDFYSTNIFSTYDVAKHIHTLATDQKLDQLIKDGKSYTFKQVDRYLWLFGKYVLSKETPQQTQQNR